MCVCVCACVRACVHTCVCVCVCGKVPLIVSWLLWQPLRACSSGHSWAVWRHLAVGPAVYCRQTQTQDLLAAVASNRNLVDTSKAIWNQGWTQKLSQGGDIYVYKFWLTFFFFCFSPLPDGSENRVLRKVQRKGEEFCSKSLNSCPYTCLTCCTTSSSNACCPVLHSCNNNNNNNNDDNNNDDNNHDSSLHIFAQCAIAYYIPGI